MRYQNRFKSLVLAVGLLTGMPQAQAYTQQTNENTKEIAKYLLNLGKYLGFDISNYCPDGNCANPQNGTVPGTQPFQSPQQNPQGGNAAVSSQLLDKNGLFSRDFGLVANMLGALLPTVSTGQNQENNHFKLIDATDSNLSELANTLQLYANKSFAGNSNNQGGGFISDKIDQKPYQTDPVNQAVLDILATPDLSYCLDVDKKVLDGKRCALNDSETVISQFQVMKNVIGNLNLGVYPSVDAFPSPNNNAQVAPQLNSDSLLGPLLLGAGQNNGAPGASGQQQGLTASSALEQALNFIRYASGAALPLSLPAYKEYADTYAVAFEDSKAPPEKKITAQNQILTYLTNLRVYAAQTSVGISNLYYILSKRMKQDAGDGKGAYSQALGEYNMATWRLSLPQMNTQGAGQGADAQQQQKNSSNWINQINNASNATVQKEIAVLLAEINYQMYLSRMQQERILLTNSLILLQNAKNNRPTASLKQTAVVSGSEESLLNTLQR